MEWISVLPNLSIGVVAIGALVYVSKKFLETLDKRADAHEKAMTAREDNLRAVEKEIRMEISSQLTNSNLIIQEATKVMGRVIHHLEK